MLAPTQWEEELPLREFVHRLELAMNERGVDGIREVLATLRPSVPSLQRWIHVRQGRYTRTLVHRERRFEVLLLAWAPGARSPIHDHGGQCCWMLPMIGAVETTSYRFLQGGDGPGPALVEPSGPPRVIQGGQLEDPLGSGVLHAVRIAEGEPWALTLHVYASPVDECLVFNPKSRCCERRRLRYDFVGPATRPEPPPDQPLRDSFWTAASRSARELLDRAREASRQLLSPSRVDDAQAQLSVHGLSHVYPGHVEALRDVNLNVRSGEFVCLLGPSGCGKSTVLYALAGHIHPTGGTVSIDGHPVTGPGPDRLLMFQDAALYPWMTAEQNVTFVLAARGLPREERKVRAREYLRLVQLDGFEDALPHQLSGGMKMRLSLARALAVDSPVLLMDEPFGSLDAQTRLQMNALLHRLWRERGKTIVFVTHDVNEAVLLGSRIVLMAPRPGRIVADLELRLSSERDPDDLQLATLAVEIRARLKAAPEADLAHDENGDNRDASTHPGSDSAGVRSGPGRPVGAFITVRPLAPVSLPRPGRRR